MFVPFKSFIKSLLTNISYSSLLSLGVYHFSISLSSFGILERNVNKLIMCDFFEMLIWKFAHLLKSEFQTLIPYQCLYWTLTKPWMCSIHFLFAYHIIIFISFFLHLIEFLPFLVTFAYIFVILPSIDSSEPYRLGVSFHGILV